MPARAEGFARVPLFERLLDARPHETSENPPLRILDEAQLQASVCAELERLFNTRRGTGRTSGLTVLDYGIPDWTGLYAGNADDRLRIERGMLRAILVFEPRLLRPTVRVSVLAGSDAKQAQQSLQVDVEGYLRNEHEAPAVLFSITLRHGGASVTPR